ncbi:unnamed protein product, partial [Heterotrigona itama]
IILCKTCDYSAPTVKYGTLPTILESHNRYSIRLIQRRKHTSSVKKKVFQKNHRLYCEDKTFGLVAIASRSRNGRSRRHCSSMHMRTDNDHYDLWSSMCVGGQLSRLRLERLELISAGIALEERSGLKPKRPGKLPRRGSQQMASHPLDHLNDSTAWEVILVTTLSLCSFTLIEFLFSQKFSFPHRFSLQFLLLSDLHNDQCIERFANNDQSFVFVLEIWTFKIICDCDMDKFVHHCSRYFTKSRYNTNERLECV